MSLFISPKLLRRNERGHRAGEGGQALLEFALVLPFVLLLVLGMLDIGKAMHYRNDLTHLANEAARFAAVNKNPGSPTFPTLEEYIRDQATSTELKDGGSSDGGPIVPLQVEICFPTGSGAIGEPVEVTVASTYKFLDFLSSATFGFSEKLNKVIVGRSTMRIEKAYDGSAYAGEAC